MYSGLEKTCLVSASCALNKDFLSTPSGVHYFCSAFLITATGKISGAEFGYRTLHIEGAARASLGLKKKRKEKKEKKERKKKHIKTASS